MLGNQHFPGDLKTDCVNMALESFTGANKRMVRILVVDDEKTLVKGILHALQQEGFDAVGVHDGLSALEQARTATFDLMVLDLMLPGLDGISVCRLLRQESSLLPIIMLTARGEPMDRVLGLEMGADDYLAKPFELRELLARIRSVLRRSSPPPPQTIGYGPWRLDSVKRQFYNGEQRIELSVREFDLLALFIKNPGRVYTREQLLDLVWELENADLRTVDVNIRRLREKIEPDAQHPIYLLTRWGVGYYLRELAE